jgi:putative transposase
MRQIIHERGSSSIIYLDESGFEASTYRAYGWAYKGKKVYGERSGNTRPRTSLIAAKQGNKLLAPVLFQGSTNAKWFNEWLEHHLCKELSPGSTIIMDNAAFHKTKETKEIIERHQHHLLYLPKYSPDFNPIEKVFAVIKKRRQYAEPNTSLDYLVKTYENYLV